MKHCKRCNRDLPYEAFAKSGQKLFAWCRECKRAYVRERNKNLQVLTCSRCRNRFQQTTKGVYYCTPCCSIRRKEQRCADPARRKADNEARRRYQQRLREEFFNVYGRECSCCGEAHVEFLTIEHYRRDGKEHRTRVGRHPHSIIRDLKRRGWPKDEGIRVHCFNCNLARTHGRTCPHEKERQKESAA